MFHRLFLLAILLQTIAVAQSVNLSIGSASGTSGGSVALSINLSSSGGVQPAGLQWSFSYSSDITSVTVVAGGAATAAEKTLSCSGTTCLIFGLNSSVIGDGVIAVATFQIASNPSSTTIPIQITGVVASTAAGTSIPASGGSGSISLPAPMPGSLTLTGLSCAPGTLGSNAASTCTVALNQTAAVATPVAISSGNAAVSVPSGVTVAANQSSATFTASTGNLSGAAAANQSAVITATLGGSTQTFTLTLVANSTTAQLAGLSCAASTLGSNATSVCTVLLDNPAEAALVVSLSSNQPSLSVPANVTIPAASSSATFSVVTSTVTANSQATLTATAGSRTRSASIVLVSNIQLGSVSCSPLAISSSGTATCSVGLSGPSSGPIVVTLSRDDNHLTVPDSVTITPGQAGANFQVQAGIATSARSVTITATAPTNTIQSSVTVLPGNPPIINAPDQLTTVFSNPVDFTISVSDFYGLPLTLAASSLPQGATFDSTTGRFQWMPSSAQIGTFAVIVTAIDSAGLSASKQVPIRVTSDKPQLLGMYNAASLVPDATCVAGSFATLVGTGFASSGFQQVASRGILPTDLSGVEVSINNVAVPLLFASDTLINFQCPNLPVHSGLTIAIKPASGPAIDPIMARVVEASPAIYTLFGTAQGAVVIAETGQVAMPVRDALPSRPARPGEFVSIYASGIGPLQEVVATGVPAPLDHTIQTTDPVTVVVSGIQVAPAFSGLAPGQVGLYQVNLQLPVKVPTGDAVPISVVVALGDGTVLTSNSVTFAVQAASTTAPTATARDSER